jgi:SOS-response transcriptional repressor LexA
MKLMSTSERIKKIMSDQGMRATDLIRATGATKGAVSQWMNGLATPSGEYLLKAASALGVDPSWLLTGRGKSSPRIVAEGAAAYGDAGMAIKVLVPLIDWSMACSILEGDICPSGEGERWLSCPISHSPRTFALRVQGDSMISPHAGGRSYPEGAIIYIDPDLAIAHGARVIACDKENRATFKVFSEDAGRRYLRPLNPQYPTIEMMDDSYRLVGKVIGFLMEE